MKFYDCPIMCIVIGRVLMFYLNWEVSVGDENKFIEIFKIILLSCRLQMQYFKVL
jgi:hypothetical protein